jgi:hypothetical protein
MTTALITVSFKLSAADLRRVPDANRSRFFREAVQEKLAAATPDHWQPKTSLGKRLATLRAARVAMGGGNLSPGEVAAELQERRGGLA